MPCEFAAEHRYSPTLLLSTELRSSRDRPPVELMVAPGEGSTGADPNIQVMVGTGSPSEEQVKLADPPSGTTVSAGCWEKDGGNGCTVATINGQWAQISKKL